MVAGGHHGGVPSQGRARASSVVSSGRAEAEGEGATVTVPGEHLEACAEGASLLALLGAEDKVGRVTNLL